MKVKSIVLIALILLLIVALQGCATVSSKEAYVACGAADVITTGIGISTGAMVEANPVINALRIGALGETMGTVVPVIGVLWLLYLALDKIDEPVLTGGVVVAECGTALRNLGFLL